MKTDIRVCPVCEHRQKRDDPARHVCASVLRETLRQTRDALSLSNAQLFVIAETVGHSDPVEGVKRLKRDDALARLWADKAYRRGYQTGVRTLLALLIADANRRPLRWLSMWWQGRAFDRVRNAIGISAQPSVSDMKNGGKSSAAPVKSAAFTASESPA